MYDSIEELLDSFDLGLDSLGDLDWGGIAAAGLGGVLGLTGGSSGSSQVSGYQGGIPQYTATRQYTPPPADRRPGSQGLRYFSNVAFTPVEPAPSTQAPATTQPSGGGAGQAEPIDYYNDNDNQGGFAYGGRVPRYAAGGLGSLGMYSDGGQMLKGPGTGQSDDIPATIEGEQPARLARDEFVIPADVVSMLGDGSSDAGAERLYEMMDRVRRAAHGKEQQQRKINPERVLPA